MHRQQSNFVYFLIIAHSSCTLYSYGVIFKALIISYFSIDFGHSQQFGGFINYLLKFTLKMINPLVGGYPFSLFISNDSSYPY